MQLSEAQAALCSKLNLDYTDVSAGTKSLFSLAEITAFIVGGAKKAWDYKPWTFTEKTLYTTVPSNFATLGYIDYPPTFEDESISLVAVDGKEFTKKIWKDYEKWFSDYPTDTGTFWTEHERFVFINTNAVTVGQQIDLSGKLRCPVISNATDLLPFSPKVDNDESSGNDAIVEFAYGEALASEKKKNQAGAALAEKSAFATLDRLWAPMGERKAEKGSQNRPFFNVPDFFSKNGGGTNIGNFP